MTTIPGQSTKRPKPQIGLDIVPKGPRHCPAIEFNPPVIL